MNKADIQKRVLQNGKPLDLNKFEWDEKAKVFSTTEDGLVLDFQGIDGITFDTGHSCTFKTGNGCIFDTGSYCTFKTGSDCTFKTGFGCTFNTGSYCTFDTGNGCTFNTWNGCIFNTWSDCTFNTGNGCIFNTGNDCIFKTGFGCVVIRRDIYEVIELEEGIEIKLNSYAEKGYTIIKEKNIINIDGKDIEISKEGLENLKKQLIK